MNEKDYNSALNESMAQITSQEILDSYGITEYTVSDIIKDFNEAMAYKQEQARCFKILDAADRSDIWKVFNRKIPNYVQTPVNNPITIIKEATKASIMPTAYAGEFRPLTYADKETAEIANKYFQMKWEAADMDSVNNTAADYAYLHGTSGVLFGWNNDIVDSTDVNNYFNPAKHIPFQAKAYHPTNIFPDPGAANVDEMRYLFFAERKSKEFLKSIPRFQNSAYLVDNSNDSLGNVDTNYIPDKSKQSSGNIVTFLTCYKKILRVKNNPITGIPQLSTSVDIIYMAGRNILDVTKDIQPNCIPFIPLYDEQVPNNFWGVSKCYKVLSMYLTLVQLDSTEATAYFKNQNPAEFINALSGLNVAEYQNKSGNPDKAFTVNCDPRVVQAFAERPELPKNLPTFRQYLISSIQQVSGVDAAYLGASYGSIQTTGGVKESIDRSTMRDNGRLKTIDRFIKRELELMVQFFLTHGKQEKFIAPSDNKHTNALGKEMNFDPMKLIGNQGIVIQVSNVAPRSNASYEDAAMKLLELQMKYQPSQNGYPDFITPEELISYLNIPKSQQNVLIERMKNQMGNMKLEEYMSVLTAVGTLTSGGMDVETALMEVVNLMQQTPLGQLPATNPNPGQPMSK